MRKLITASVAALIVASPAYASDGNGNGNSNGNGSSTSNGSELSLESLTTINTVSTTTSTLNADVYAGGYGVNFNGMVVGDGAITASGSGLSNVSLDSCGCANITGVSNGEIAGNLNGGGMISAGVSGSVVAQIGSLNSTTTTTTTTTTTNSQGVGF